jgi:hypothetical protein
MGAQSLLDDNGWAKGYYILVHGRDRRPNKEYRFLAVKLGIKFSLLSDCASEADGGSFRSIWTVDITTLRESGCLRRREQFGTRMTKLRPV